MANNEPKANHNFFMYQALSEAQKALAMGEVPVGAVIVDENNTIIGTGYNHVEKNGCQTLHAELIAIRQATKAIKSWRLEKCWLYVTLEPCLMCLGAIGLSRLEGVAFGAASPEYGGLSMLDIERRPTYFKGLMILKGLKENECAEMLKSFFKKARNSD
jgi:tRNA(adenine34) deaminase